MSILIQCQNCKWEKEFPEKTKVNDLPEDCPVCNSPTIMTAIADWLRGINPSAIGD